MSGCKNIISLIVVLVSLFSSQAFPQQIDYRDSLAAYNSREAYLKPRLNYSVGSTFLFVPHYGTVTGFTVSPFLSVPLSAKWSVDGGIIAGRYYSALSNLNPEGEMNGAFNMLSVYGSATYHVNSKLTVYGMGLKQLSNSSPLNSLPKSSYAIGSSYNFGHFSIGVTLEMSQLYNDLTPLPFNGAQGFYPSYNQRPGPFNPFGR